MLIIRGVNLYPTQIEEILLSLADVAPHYQLVVTRTGTLDDLELRAEVSEIVAQNFTQNEPIGEETEHNPAMRELQAAIQQSIKGSLGLTLHVSLAMPGTIPRSEGGKLKRTVDLREL
jgi:phenylacetate-CoA ligase